MNGQAFICAAGRAPARGVDLHVPVTAHVIVTPSGRYAAVHE
ncbi:hypothetical protein [Sorangium cellulosum]|nr:hypothetical protein [Sorangium cellulosum]